VLCPLDISAQLTCFKAKVLLVEVSLSYQSQMQTLWTSGSRVQYFFIMVADPIIKTCVALYLGEV